ncbi:methyltransferase domain-containing protein [Christensenellaceae bacterium OttesenSCG-928-K19]|nr:methyltransferase domain-containing protein [Christensenellaceae bacterium OttesenSCG-928-K19]
MEQYEALASVYDELMYDVPYKKWADYIVLLLEKNGVPNGKVLEYACGTGNITLGLAQAGFDLVATDVSPEMLDVARAKLRAAAYNPQFVCADMAKVWLENAADAAVCACDGVNYLLDKKKLESFFARVQQNLKPHGVFLFDISSAYKLETLLGNEFFYDDGDTQTVFWQNSYDKAGRRVTMEITLFIKNEQVYHRLEETHVQRAWMMDELEAALIKSGFDVMGVFGFLTEEKPDADVERIQFVAKKKETT